MLDKRNFYINGKWVTPSKPNDFKVINPSNEEPYATISLGDVADINSAVKAAKEAFTSWKQTSKEERISLIQKLLEIYKSRWSDMSATISMEMGAPIEMATEQQCSTGAGHIKAFIQTLKDLIKNAILDGIIKNSYQEAYDYLLVKAKEIGIIEK